MPLASFETNLIDFMRGVDGPVVTVHLDDDVLWCTSHIHSPMFNGALGARFPRQAAAQRANEVLGDLIDHGRPFLWWLTPNTRTPELESTLLARGLVSRGPTNAMSLEMRAATDVMTEVPTTGISIEAQTAENTDDLFRVMVAGFGMASELTEAMGACLSSIDGPRTAFRNLLARLDGEPIGAGSVMVCDGIAGLYNIAVLPRARGRGIGRALTVALLRTAAELGASESILHASELGEPVYAKVGYRIVGHVERFFWTPPETTDPAHATGAERLA